MWASLASIMVWFLEKVGYPILMDLLSQLTTWVIALIHKKEQSVKDNGDARALEDKEKDPAATLKDKNDAEKKLLNS